MNNTILLLFLLILGFVFYNTRMNNKIQSNSEEILEIKEIMNNYRE